MRIDKEKLTELLVEKTGLEPSSVENQLNELTERIQKTAEKGKALEIKGFGMFYYTKKGELTFDPSEDFATEVNYKYAGMEAVEINRTEAADTEGAVAEEPEVPDSEKSESSTVAGQKGEPVRKRKERAGSDAAMEPKAADSGSSKKTSRKKERDSIMTLIVTVITIILLASILMFVMDRPMDDPEPEVTGMAEPTPSPEPEPDEITVPDPETAPEIVSGDDPGPETDAVAVEPEKEAIADLYGLYGTVQPLEQRTYSIILHSMQSRSRAVAVSEELQEAGYRSLLSEIEHDELGILWRVGIGQFESIPEAMEAASGLPDTYRDNHFIGRIQ